MSDAGAGGSGCRRVTSPARFLPNTKILTLCGGQPFGAQRDSLQHAPHIIVATPGRLLDHLQKETVSLDALHILVMDEADRMLDMGFSDAIDEVIRFAPATRQTLLFSATWPEAIAAISGRVQQQPIRIEIDTVDALPAIEQQFFETSAHEKISLLQTLLSQHQPASCVVFCNTKKDCQAVCDALNAVGQSALALHGDLEQRDRDQTLVRFANGSARILVATDVAARGLDIKSLELVVNYELARDPEVHVHRIGRTARAGSSGTAISFCAPEEAQRANILSEMLQLKLNWLNAPARQPLLPLAAEMATLCIDGGKKAKMRPGDILGALTGDIGLDGADIGKINVHPMHVYVAVRQAVAQKHEAVAKREDQRQVMPGTAIKMIDSMASQRSAETPADYFTSITSSRNASKEVSSSSGCQPAGCKGISSRSNAKSPPSTTSEP